VSAFRREGDQVVVEFDEVEASLLRHLVGQIGALLDADEPPAEFPTEFPTGAPRGATAGPDAGDDRLAELADLDGPPPEPPTDPVLARLLPEGYRDDAESAGEFRRLTEPDLRQQKRENAARLLADLPGEDGGEVRLDRETTETWLTALNDVRLALGTRLDVTEDMPEPDEDDPDAPAYVVYAWLSQLQDVLVQLALESPD
jgi:hypothetical protein